MNRLILTLLSAVFMSAPAYAQEEVTSLLVPSSAWLVGPATLADGAAGEGVGIPCVMVNKFSNNVEMRLSGGGEAILAMALTVDEKTFTKDESYLISIGFTEAEGVQLPAQAFSEETLVIGLEPGKDFYKALKGSDAMYVTLGTGKMEFSLLGVLQALVRLEQCYQPEGLVAPAPEAAAPVEKSIPEPEGIRTIDPEETKNIAAMIKTADDNSLPPAVVPETPEVSKPLPEPVQAPAKQQVKPRDILTPGTATAVTGEGQQMRWRVMKGANLQSIFEVWAQSANARLIWNAGQGFSVLESLAMQGTFEGAVEAVLGQFPPGQVRPVGKIYIDPTLKQKVLVIETDKPAIAPVSEGNYAPIGSP